MESLPRLTGESLLVATKDRKPLPGQISMFSNTNESRSWTAPTDLPSLGDHKVVGYDCETDGKDKHRALPVGYALAVPGRKMYLPVGHTSGNMDREKVERYLKGELKDKQLVGLNIGFDADVTLNAGTDLESQGCTLHDIAHSAALLNENRFDGFNLDALGKEFVGRGKNQDEHLEMDKVAQYEASMFGPYAEDDAELALDVHLAQRGPITAQGLDRVEGLEDRLLWANNHIERSAARLDRAKLERWVSEVPQAYGDLIIKIWDETGYKVYPNRPDSWLRLLDLRGLDEPTAKTKKGKVSVTNDFLKAVSDPVIADALKARRLDSLNVKYIKKYWKKIGAGDLLRFNLYQLRAAAGEEDDFGTITGRYSSSNVNIQQLFKVENQVKLFGDDFIIRELVIPDEGMELFAGDASQIEFRIFAHDAFPFPGGKDLVAAYCDNPKVDFHALVASLLGQTRNEAKHNNFGKLYGMGLEKLSGRLGLRCNCGSGYECGVLLDGFQKTSCYDLRKLHGYQIEGGHCVDCPRHIEGHATSCPARQAIAICKKYDDEFPAAKKLLKHCTEVVEKQGFIRSILARRRRFPDGRNLHKALNARIQMSAADVFKMKLDYLYTNRKSIGIHKLRMPVHDEATGDIPKGDEATRKRLIDAFQTAQFNLRVPTMWDVTFGANWRQCSGK